MGYVLPTQYPAKLKVMNANLAQIPQKAREIVITDSPIVWESGAWSIGIDMFVIGDDSVKVSISGQGKCILRQGLENEAEYEEFEREIEYSFEDLGVDENLFYMLDSEDAINEIIFLTAKAVKNEY